MALVCHTGLACRAWGAQTSTRDGRGKEDRGRGSCKLVERFAHNAQAGQHNSRSITKKWTAMAAQTTTKQVAENSAESALLEALIGVQGRGRSASKQQLQEIAEAVSALEAEGGVPNPTASSLIEGRWQLIYTTRPGTASPIQRTFVGVDAFTVFQEILLRSTDNSRVANIVKFSEKIGELKVEAAATIESGQRILFRFDKAAFTFKFLPFKVPYPVPFKLLGDEAKGWLDTTYLSPTGTLRISKGNKGTTFVLQKTLDPQQRLLQAISAKGDVEKEIEELVRLNPITNTTDFSAFAGKWRQLWSSQAAEANWLQKATSGIPNWQIVEGKTGRFENLVRFLPGFQLRAKAQSEEVSKQRLEVKIEGVDLEVGPFCIPFKITAAGYTDLLYLTEKIRITKGNRGSIFVHCREQDSD
ncbi:unnamed protein product [Sphagnum jensenii]|uniref:Plastid lipid-associated protein/fibrillin conserved domain-containing protein n=1 Tax=Sphagnum jensenii TaxID=128206 RepID=A0ABP1ARF1_9BRYO